MWYSVFEIEKQTQKIIIEIIIIVCICLISKENNRLLTSKSKQDNRTDKSFIKGQPMGVRPFHTLGIVVLHYIFTLVPFSIT